MTSRRRSRKLRAVKEVQPLTVDYKPASPRAHMPTKSLRRDVSLLNVLTLLKQNRRELDQEIERQVRAARRAGASWERIGEALGVTASACEKRWGPYPLDQSRVPRQTTAKKDESAAVAKVSARRTPTRDAAP
jgi:hypothetical protein